MRQIRHVLSVLCVALSSCSIVGDAVRDAAEESAMVPAGSIVAGDGFTVRSPAAGLHVVRNQPRRGFLSLRSSTPVMLMGSGGSYNVYPFSRGSSSPTLRDAWSTHALSQFSSEMRAGYRILSEDTGVWRGQPAYFQSSYSQQSPSGGGAVSASCFFQHGTMYYWILRSVPVLDNNPSTIQRERTQAERELRPLLNSVQFN